MKKVFTKIAGLSVGLAMAIGVGVAVGSRSVKEVRAESETTWTASEQGFSNEQQLAGNSYNFVDASVSVTFNALVGTNGHKYYNSGSAVRSYGGESFTISCSAGNLTSITLSNTQSKEVTADVGTYSSNNWTGSASSVTFTVATGSGNFRTSTITAVFEGSGPTDPLTSITVTGSMSKTAYYVGESWSAAGLTATGTYETAGQVDITDKVTWSFDPATPAVSVTSVVATASIGEVSGSSSAQTVSVSRANPIQVLYTKSASESVDVYGYYVGFLDGTGPVIMDGAYGIVIYNKSADVSGYTEKETILHVTGSISIYKGLYEIGGTPSISIASGTFDAPDTPVVYATKGGETADYASRLTTVTGVPTVTSGSFDSDAGTVDITMSFAVGTKTVQVFYKKAAQTADADAFAAIKAAVADSTEITIKGFTGWYNGFQVQMNGYIAPAESYTAEDFAQDLLDQTDAVCAGWEEGDNNHDALEAIWSDLASNDKYPSLPAAQKTILADANRDESGTVVEQAMARYDFLTGKYNLSNFINGRTPIVPAGRIDFSNDISQNSSMIIIVSIAATSALAFTMLLVFKKKKQK